MDIILVETYSIVILNLIVKNRKFNHTDDAVKIISNTFKSAHFPFEYTGKMQLTKF